ncbi:MAG: hypothetical protein KME56_09895 [Candidatus Thiodiazotropha sp. (ex Ctena orbiculata)]|uniref:Uncharacterized protein n=1 Tax=Candidatus Thiodiazotropha taylori TaxID=2792791 RepID=A0A944M8U0_9GAMM|nr:hypothetical protein [Candidatus Thiodiazotropha taylori]MBT2989353.1 hypothetical protein [Candidatus Thiodiazotropha taylori]MBT2996933.1 hypothetical protein [Candidatus Thiodiazotropha taylori]MBT3000788.1 hypothetical protein [Candidatus Thiodiazotropha taylori]MBT3026916.1 hypothetical protein [Candidatus Thiodiazotropha taylori]
MKMILATAAMILSANLYATSYDDLYGVVGNDHDFYIGSSDSNTLPTAVQPGIGDQYGSSFLYSEGFAKTNSKLQPGHGDGYGSSLIDVGASVNW